MFEIFKLDSFNLIMIFLLKEYFDLDLIGGELINE